MPRSQRKRSESGFYHVVTKGDGGQVIFESDADRLKYLNILETAANELEIEIHAYCLMSNHVHLLVRDGKDTLSDFMKQLDEDYARYFSWKTGHVGHVFNGRFWSEPIEVDKHYLATLRYIHANPEPANICRACDYPWSSYRAYEGFSSFVTTDFALQLLGGANGFEKLQQSGGSFAKPFGKSTLRGHLGVDELTRIASNLVGHEELNLIKSLKPAERRTYLETLSNAGFSEREIARITGIGQSSVHMTLQ